MNKYRLNERYAWKNLDDKSLVLDTHTGDYFVCNGSGSEIWQGLMNEKVHAEIAKNLCHTFTVSEEEAAADVNAFIERLVGDGILTCNKQKGDAT